MKKKIAYILALLLLAAAPASALLFDVFNLPSDGELPVWCPVGYQVKMRTTQATPGRKGLVYCVPVTTATQLPALMAPIDDAAPAPSLPTMPTQ